MGWALYATVLFGLHWGTLAICLVYAKISSLATDWPPHRPPVAYQRTNPKFRTHETTSKFPKCGHNNQTMKTPEMRFQTIPKMLCSGAGGNQDALSGGAGGKKMQDALSSGAGENHGPCGSTLSRKSRTGSTCSLEGGSRTKNVGDMLI